MAAHPEEADEVRRLQRCIADLVSVLALPAMWAGGEPSRVVHTLLEALIGMLHLDLAYVRLRAPDGAAPQETVRVAPSLASILGPDEMRAGLEGLVSSDPMQWSARAQMRFAGEPFSLLALPLGLNGETGVFVAGCQRADFPADTERLVLSVAANQAAISLQEARLLSEQRRARDELGRGVVFREQLMGILGHDLRNPLSAVYGLAERLQLDASLSLKAKERVALIKQASARMSEMIDTILDFTRIRFDDEGLPIRRSAMDLGSLCRDVVAEALAGHPGRQVSLETAGDLRGQWDRARLAQVVSNLLGNALTHGEEMQPVRLVTTADAAAVTLGVVNRGPTIPADRIEALFEPFVRGAASGQDERRHGLGLGLYIAKQIVASHGGTLSARSLDGTTTFTVVLPRSSG